MSAYFALFASAFLAATLLPLSSEAVLAAIAAAGRGDQPTLWLVASVGNTLGSVVNYVLGRFFMLFQHRPWFPIKPPALERASTWYRRFGLWSLLFAWVPVLGDPLTLIAGVLRANFLAFLVLVFVGKAGRYAVLLGLVAVAAE